MGRCKILFIISTLLILSSCGPGPKVKTPSTTSNSVDKPPVPGNLTVSSITYVKNLSSTVLFPPYAGSVSLPADFGSGSCLGATTQVDIEGIYDNVNATSVMMTGVVSTQTLIGSKFKFTACFVAGATAITITSYNSASVANPAPVSLSINVTSIFDPTFKTLGNGHPRYPNTGIDVSNLSLTSGPKTSGALTLKSGFVGAIGVKAASTGNPTLTLDMGFANYLRQSSP
jgi:hypothetical protein